MIHYQNKLVDHINGPHKQDQQARRDKARQTIDACYDATGDEEQWHHMCSDFVKHFNREEQLTSHWINDFNNLVIGETNKVIDKQNAVNSKMANVLHIDADSGVHQSTHAEREASKFYKQQEGMTQLDAAIVQYNNKKYNPKVTRLDKHGKNIIDECLGYSGNNKQSAVCTDIAAVVDMEFNTHNKWHGEINAVYNQEQDAFTAKINAMHR